jgi:diguanylate cyclase (GGDEF)-like protein
VSHKKLIRLFWILAMAMALLLAAFFLVTGSVRHLVNSESAHRAEAWAQSLMSQVGDLQEIVAGEDPSEDSIMFMEQARTIGDVWQYMLFDKSGKLVLVSSQLGRSNTFDKSLSDFGFELAKFTENGRAISRPRNGRSSHEPELLTETLVPIASDGKVFGYLLLAVDETARTRTNQTIISGLAVMLLGLIAVAFGVPGIAFIRRTQQKEMVEGQLEYLAYHDGLTGLSNRNAITRILDHAITQNRNSKSAVFLIDLDHFKGVNDTHGHEAGDTLLREVANRLQTVCAGRADVGRTGGDEFIVVQHKIGGQDDVEKLARRILAAMKKPVRLETVEIDCGASIGISLYPLDGKNTSEVLKAADTALYVAKGEGRGCYCLFKPEYDARLQRRLLVEARLRVALKSSGFSLALQPIFNLASGDIESVEALLRLHDPEIGTISPVEFIPIAEEAGLIEEIGRFVIDESCRTLSLLPQEIRLSLNLSPVQFSRGDIVATVSKALAAYHLNPKRLELEVTEGLLLRDSVDVQDKIASLKEIGCTLALDDFGAGYSSLKYLWRYPFDKIKIDRSFIEAMDGNDDVRGIVETIIGLGRKLNMTVTAEGVETLEQAQTLKRMSCDQVQGFYYAKPMPLGELAALLMTRFAETRPGALQLKELAI